MKVERVSYDVMTPSAARGVVEAILWKPSIRWIITRIDVLKSIQWESVRRNEVGAVISTDLAKTAMKNGTGKMRMYVEENRQQRAGLILKDVAYLIHAFFEVTTRAGPEDSVTKFEQIFLRRAEKGQCFHRPYLGCREFSAHFTPITFGHTAPEPIAESGDLGWMLHDLDFSGSEPTPRFFRARLSNGCLSVPPFNDCGVKA
jgi:CRISPR-associated protein Cas5d